MARIRLEIWTSMKATQEQVATLADHLNTKLTPAHQVDVVKIGDNWHMITGTPQAKLVCQKEIDILTEMADKKAQFVPAESA